MRTLILIVACIGIGYWIADLQFRKRTSGMNNIMGAEADMEAVITKAKSPDAKRPGKIEVVGGTEFDFGTMRRGTKRSHTFVFKNVGELPVELAYKTSSCKCTVGKLDAKKLDPGEQTDVELEWLAEGKMEEFGQTATISTNAIDQEEIKLSIKGKIGQAYVFDPPSADLRDFLASEEKEIKGRLYSFEETPLEISAVRWLDDSLSKKITGEIGDVKKLEKGEIEQFADARYVLDFKIHFHKGIPSGTLSGNMGFTKKSSNQDENEEVINFPVQGRAVSTIRVVGSPDYNEERNIFDLGVAKSDVGLKKSFVLSVKIEDSSDIQLKLGRISPEMAEKALKVSIAALKTSPKQKMFAITLEIPPGGPAGGFAGAFSKDFAKIVLETNLETAPEFPMYIKFRILE